ncbi:MAG TPA: flagellar export protein FliJ [Verrucomicrobiae bacterium]|nr:flagellar export protein FliJ [Verrucomicrobiae bacterium]
MKPFHFTLEAVRTIRQRHEQVAMEQYAQALLNRQLAAERLNSIQGELDACWKELRGHMVKGCSASTVSQAHDYHRVVTRRRDEGIAALGVAERRVNAAMQTMLAARQQREIVDKSFEKQKAHFHREQFRTEQKLMDDLAGRRSSLNFLLDPTEAL